MIPKIIHYCWFGKRPMPTDTLLFISQWKSLLPDYEFIEWNESNFDTNLCAYSREAYLTGHYAHVSDVCRLYALINYGGIYLDTDAELLKTFDGFLDLEVFMGSEGARIGTNVIGAAPGNPFITRFLEYYLKHSFINFWGHPERTPNTAVLMKHVLPGLDLRFWPTVFPFEFFCCKDYHTGEVSRCAYSVAIHHFAASWRVRRTLRSRVMTIIKGLKIKYLYR